MYQDRSHDIEDDHRENREEKKVYIQITDKKYE